MITTKWLQMLKERNLVLTGAGLTCVVIVGGLVPLIEDRGMASYLVLAVGATIAVPAVSPTHFSGHCFESS